MAADRLYTTRTTRFLEWIGLTLLTSWLRLSRPGLEIEDVHANRMWFDRGIDLVLSEGGVRTSVDVKVDSYYGQVESRKLKGVYNMDSGAILLETISQLQYDRDRLASSPDVPGWFWTSEADEVYHYYLALIGPRDRLKQLYQEWQADARVGRPGTSRERALVDEIQVERDLLVKYSLPEARQWYRSAHRDALGPFVGAANPGYVTVSRRVDRDLFLSAGPGKSLGSPYSVLRRTQTQAGGPIARTTSLETSSDHRRVGLT